jgi:4-hydroxybenzoate polyprenyltransferase
MGSTAHRTPQVSRPRALFRLLRLNRSVMVAAIAGSSAYVAGAGGARALWMTLAGWCLAVGGFSLDFYADRDLDVEGPRARARHNPLADGSLAPRTGFVFSLAFLTLSLILTALASPASLPAWGLVLAVIVGLALHLFETPIARALTLGLLQALYVLLGGLAGQLSLGLLALAGTFFFAMFGGRGMIDIRDYPQDQATRVRTLPKRYGVRRTAWFTALCLLIAFALSLAAYWTGEFGSIYLYLALVFAVVGTVCAGLFAAHPTPRLAHVLTLVFMMGMGSLICIAMILGSASRDAHLRERLSARIDRARARWDRQGIDSYRIVVRNSSLWHWQTHDIVVRNGVVERSSATCTPALIEGRECQVRPFDPLTYTVDGLYERARWLAERGDPQWIAIEFHARYGYPTRIRYDDPEIQDEEWAWGVEEFEMLE